MHEWTDGCSSQCKGRHCIGQMLATRWQISNFQQFEMSHVKGPLDGAGANLNFQADMAVIRGQKVI